MIAILLLATFSLPTYAADGSAKSLKAVEVVGDVYVTKAGGSKSYRVFQGMEIQRNDYVETGPKGRLILVDESSGDEILIEKNSSIYVSELSESSGVKKSKFKMWAGSIWNKVKTLAGADDEFEIDTPTAVMGVRGTHFILVINPATGLPEIYVSSGVVESETEQTRTLVYPAQKLVLFSEDNDLVDSVAYIDPQSVTAQLDSSIIEKMLLNKAAIDEENEQLLQQLGVTSDGSTSTSLPSDEESLERYRNNVQNVLHHLLKHSVEQGKLSNETAEKIIETVNQSIIDSNRKYDLEQDIPPIELSDEEKLRQEAQRRAEERRQQQEEEKLRRLQELQSQHEELLQQVKEQRRLQEEANQQAQEEAQRRAEEELKNQLDEEQRRALEERRRQREEELARQQATANASEEETQTPPQQSSPGSGSSTPPPPPPPQTSVEVKASEAEWNDGILKFDVEVSLANIPDLYGAQLHLLTKYATGRFHYDELEGEIYPVDWFTQIYSELNGNIFDPEQSVYDYRINELDENESYDREFMYSVVNVPPASKLAVQGKKRLITIPLLLEPYSLPQGAEVPETLEIKIEKLLLSDSQGNLITIQNFNNGNDTIIVEVPTLP